MSNYLAIATVTAALQQMLQSEVGRDVPGVQVTTVRPDAGNNTAGACINVFLYQATPNPAWRNADLRTRRPRGDLTKHSQAALDLHYLFTFYGNEQELEPQRLMGSTIRVLADHPLLTQDMIDESLEHTTIPALEESTLAEQIQLVKFLPSTITTEDLSRIWSIFFQVPYALSFAYQATAVMIQGEKAGQVALPVRQRTASVLLSRPVLKQIEHYPPDELKEWANTITLGSRIMLQGKDFTGEGTTLVQIGKSRLRPQILGPGELSLNFPELPEAEQNTLRGGGQSIQVLRVKPFSEDMERDLAIESNLLPFVLCPRIADQGGVTLAGVSTDNEDRYSGTVTVELDISVDVRQRVFLLLNGTSQNNPSTYIFRANRRRTLEHTMEFAIQDVMPGEYLVRVQVDGAESPLRVDERKRYIGPRLVIA